ncbi:MAG: hypothetical protein AAFV95_26855 [Bacteroidota bacterium]
MKSFYFALAMLLTMIGELSAQSTDKNFTNKSRLTKFELAYQLGGTPRNHYFAYNDGIRLSLTHGIRLRPRFSLSAGLGYERLKEGELMPLMVDAQWTTPNGRTYWNFKMGHSIGWSHRSSVNPDYDYKGGYLFGLGYGSHLFQWEKLGLAFQASYNYRHTRLRYLPEPGGSPFTSHTRIHLVSFGFVVII